MGEQRAFASEPLDSPDTELAVWALNEGRLLYGNPGQRPLLALACEGEEDARQLVITRFAAADPQAKALMPLIGNGHVERLKVEAVWNGRAWLWQGSYPAADPRLDVLTGPRKVELTIPGAGSVEINPSQRPALFIDECRGTLPEIPDEEPDQPIVEDELSEDAAPVQ